VSIVTVAALELAAEHTPLATTARNAVACVSGSVVSGLSVEPTSDQVIPPSVEACHLTIAPVAPLRLTLVPVPLHTAALPAVAAPPTETGSTVMVATLELAAEHTPLCTTARNAVATVNGPVPNGLAVDPMSDQLLPPSVEPCHLMIAPV
jgi:hypothetical protein